MMLSDALVAIVHQAVGLGAALGAALGVLPELVASWLLTYALHSSLVLAAAWMVTRCLSPRAQLAREIVWKTAVVGALLGTSWQVTTQATTGWQPLGGRLAIGRQTIGRQVTAADPAVELPGLTTSHGVAGLGAAVPIEAVPAAPRTALAADATRPAVRSAAAAPITASAPGAAATATASASDTATRVKQLALRLARLEPLELLQSLPVVGTLNQHGLRMATAAGRQWPRLLCVAWLAGALYGLIRLARTWLALAWRLHRRRPIVDGPLHAILAALCRDAGLARPIRLAQADGIPGPVALGRSAICVPGRLLTELSPAEQRGVLAHELAHLLRRDPFWLIALSTLRALLFFQPLQAVAERQLREAAEFQCDDWAVQRTGSSLSLARCLARVATWLDRAPHPTPLASMAASRSSLVRRVERILAATPSIPPRRTAVLTRPAAALGVIALAAIVPCVAAIDAPRSDGGRAGATRSTVAPGTAPSTASSSAVPWTRPAAAAVPLAESWQDAPAAPLRLALASPDRRWRRDLALDLIGRHTPTVRPAAQRRPMTVHAVADAPQARADTTVDNTPRPDDGRSDRIVIGPDPDDGNATGLDEAVRHGFDRDEGTSIELDDAGTVLVLEDLRAPIADLSGIPGEWEVLRLEEFDGQLDSRLEEQLQARLERIEEHFEQELASRIQNSVERALERALARLERSHDRGRRDTVDLEDALDDLDEELEETLRTELDRLAERHERLIERLERRLERLEH
jgi:beta-lactamase regulating signal transducer with metallopeptidase domain